MSGTSASKKPLGLIVGSSLRPDGVTLIPWVRGKCLAWDVTIPDKLTASHLLSTRTNAGAAAEHAATKKNQKYSALDPTHIVVPLAVETFGP